MKRIVPFIISAAIFLSFVPVYADTNTATKEISYPNDPLLERQWYYEAVKGYAFRNNNITGQGVKVGIIDTGLTKEFKTFHDFEEVDIQTGINICAKIDNNKELLYDTSDNQTHGTGVASVICSKADNEHGIAGLTDNCTIIPYKVEDFRCSKTANSLLAIIKAIDVAYENNCDVVNISQGSVENLEDKYINMLERAVDKAVENGMIIISATGNDGKNTNITSYPAACDNVIGVGSVEPICDREDSVIDAVTEIIKPESEYTSNDTFFTGWLKRTVQNLPDNAYKRTSSSTANESVYVCAPGSGITTADPVDASSWTDKVNSFSENSGTSFATPIVASAAIGVKQMRPYVDVDMFKEILKATAVDLEDEGYDINTGYGMVNFERIYDYVSQMPLTAPERTPEITIDYENEQLVGFPINREYTVNGEAVTLNDDFSLPIKDEWFGTTIEIVKKASSESYEDSLPQLLEIPEKAAPPTIDVSIDYANERLLGLESGKEYTINGEDVTLNTFVYPTTGTGFEIADDWFGTTVTVAIKNTDISKEIEIPERPEVTGLSGDKSMIIGTTTNMQYRKQGTTTWHNCSDGSTRVSFLSGTAEVYIKATDMAFKSDITTVQVGAAATPTAVPTATPTVEPTATPTAKPTLVPTAEPTEAPTALPTSIPTPTETPTATPTLETTLAPTVEPTAVPAITATPTTTAVPTADPTTEPTAAPIISFLPTIDYENGRIIGLDSTKEYTVNGADVTICTYSSGEIGFDIDELWYGKTLILAVKGTDEVRMIKVEFPDEQYELETFIEYKDGICTYSAVNNTIWTINATGIITVYAQNGALKHLETVDAIPADGINKRLNFTLSDGDRVRFFVWDSIQSMQPRDKVKLSEYIVTFGEVE